MKIDFYKKITSQKIIEFARPERIYGGTNIEVTGATALDLASEGDLSFCNYNGRLGKQSIISSEARLIICHKNVAGPIPKNKCLLLVENPRLSFIQCVNQYRVQNTIRGINSAHNYKGIHSVDRDIFLGKTVHIDKEVKIGEGTVIENGAQIGWNTRIGERVHIQSGAVIGCIGQGYERDRNGHLVKLPQVGGIIIEDAVEIGGNSTIVRGTFENTFIGEGTKIGQLVDIGHNAHIGKHVFISVGVIVSGSAIIGNFSWLSPGCCIKDGIKIGKRVTVGMGAVVIKDVPNGLTVVGVPARPLKKQGE